MDGPSSSASFSMLSYPSHLVDSPPAEGVSLPDSSTSPYTSNMLSALSPAGAQIPSVLMSFTSPPTPAPSPRPKTAYEPLVVAAASDKREMSAASRTMQMEFGRLSPHSRKLFLADLIRMCEPEELLHVSALIAPRLKRDFLRELPIELALHILYFIDDPKSLARASLVSRTWHGILSDEFTWKTMCLRHNFKADAPLTPPEYAVPRPRIHEPLPNNVEGPERLTRFNSLGSTDRTLSTDSLKLALEPSSKGKQRRVSSSLPRPTDTPFSYRRHFKMSYLTESNWRKGGRLLRSHRSPDGGVVTTIAMDNEWIVIGLANGRIHVFACSTGFLARTLIGHESGVWGICLVSRGGSPPSYTRHRTDTSPETSNYASGSKHPRQRRASESRISTEDLNSLRLNVDFSSDPDKESTSGQGNQTASSSRLGLGLGLGLGASSSTPSLPYYASDRTEEDGSNNEDPKQSDPCCASTGWGQDNSIVVSGGCDRILRVWDIKSGYCLHSLQGHTATIRCMKVLNGRPIAVTGSRDTTVQVWDVSEGRHLRTLRGHTESVRCLDVWGNQVVSGSYDCTCRLWDVDTGECLRVFEGHFHQIYAVAFDGIRVCSGGLDATIRVFSASTGQCLATLTGHTSLVCQIQMSGSLLISGGSDGRVIMFDLASYSLIKRHFTHDSSVSSLQFDDKWLVSAGNDGRVQLYDMQHGPGKYVRDLTDKCETIWKVSFRKERLVIVCKRMGKTVMEIWDFKPREDEL